MIDEKRLLLELKKMESEYYASEFEEDNIMGLGVMMAIRKVKDAPTIETELKWIPASEPPKESGAYFATIDDSFAKESKLGITVYDGSNWNTWGNIIAWMPLPETYKMDKNPPENHKKYQEEKTK